ncbi:hypothetical protein NDN08_003646 [Rhodosorus marinus]|uniref:Tetraspanin n=1 Tax=Rhodosorus marinus TaxID=101924 RepID=A0AAV8UYP2_9RHOD|nr:hypothetical protein NDN08_003646 [Rhodosorus marinus]
MVSKVKFSHIKSRFWPSWSVFASAFILGNAIALYVIGFGSFRDFGSDPVLFENQDTTTSFIPVASAAAGLIIIGTLLLLDVFGRQVLAWKKPEVLEGFWWNLLIVVLELGFSGVLLYIGIVSLQYAGEESPADLRADAQRLWEEAVVNDTALVCTLQDEFSCAGFDSGDCIEPDLTTCPACDPPVDPQLPGCFGSMLEDYQDTYRSVGNASVVCAGFLCVDVLMLLVKGYLSYRSEKMSNAVESEA